MHTEDWSGTRVAAALARLGDAGYPQSRLARMAGVNRSQVNRWSRGENRPGHDAVRRLAAAVWREHPDVARELVEASGYAWAEPADAERSPPPARLREETREAIREDLGNDVIAEQVIAYVEGLASGRIEPSVSEDPGAQRPANGEGHQRGRG